MTALIRVGASSSKATNLQAVEEHPLSRIGLGAWAFGGVGWGPQDDRDSIAAIHRAVELGVNWIDTAAVYGGGHAELVVGKALSDLACAERPLVFTKAGVHIDPDTGKTYRDLSPTSLRAECEASLKRLGVEHIDLYQLHWPVADPDVVVLAWETLGELRTEGKIRWAGVSNFEVPLLERCASSRPIDTAQVPLSLVSRRSADHILPWALLHGTYSLVYSPLESGLLSGRFSLDRLAALPADDWRQHRLQFQTPGVERSLRLVELLRPICDEIGVSVTELAIAWCLRWPAVTGAIVGARSSDQVDGWINAGALTLEDAILDRISTALHETGAGEGPRTAPHRPATPATA
jgi:aryl-alcohol dehydrogenase-like predicted oxidoreductase